jgi:hypothetical protein
LGLFGLHGELTNNENSFSYNCPVANCGTVGVDGAVKETGMKTLVLDDHLF